MNQKVSGTQTEVCGRLERGGFQSTLEKGTPKEKEEKERKAGKDVLSRKGLNQKEESPAPAIYVDKKATGRTNALSAWDQADPGRVEPSRVARLRVPGSSRVGKSIGLRQKHMRISLRNNRLTRMLDRSQL